MDRIVPTDTGRASYDVIYGHNQEKLKTPITSLAIGELIDEYASFFRRLISSASSLTLALDAANFFFHS